MIRPRPETLPSDATVGAWPRRHSPWARPGVTALLLASASLLAGGAGCRGAAETVDLPAAPRPAEHDADDNGSLDAATSPVDGFEHGTGTDEEGPVEARPRDRALANEPDVDVPRAIVGAEGDSTRPLLPTLSGDDAEALEIRVAVLRSRYEWPRGMYPFRLREPDPLAGGRDGLAGVWRMISRAHAEHSALAYEPAIALLDLALGELTEHPDTLLVAFNLGAAHQSMGEEHRDRAIAAFERVLGVAEDAAGDVRWRNEPFRHFAACALAQLNAEAGNRRRAVAHAFAAARLYPKRDPITGQVVGRGEAADVLLPTLYAYGGQSIHRESRQALRRLLTSLAPNLSGRSAEDMLENVLISAIERLGQLPAANDPAAENWPALYTRTAVQRLYTNWMSDYPDHPRRSDMIRRASAANLGAD